MKGIFVTGTDTGVGKTFISCIIAECLGKEGINVGVLKPVETGCKERKDFIVPSDGISLKKAAGVNDYLDLIVPYRFRAPLAPFMAAQLEGKKIDIRRIKRSFLNLSKKHSFIIIEGAGGLLVPITKSYTYLNLIKNIGIPVIVVAANKLGVINHTLLTLNCLKENKINTLCVILNNTQNQKDIAQKTNLSVLQRLLTGIKIIELPFNPDEKSKKKIVKFLKSCKLI